MAAKLADKGRKRETNECACERLVTVAASLRISEDKGNAKSDSFCWLRKEREKEMADAPRSSLAKRGAKKGLFKPGSPKSGR